MIYSIEEVLKKVSNGEIDLTNLHQRRISQTQVIIEVMNKQRFSILTIPDYLKHNGLADTLCHSFTLPNYALEISISEKRTRNETVLAFIEFVHHKYEQEQQRFKGTIPSHCFSDWLEYLKHSSTPYKAWHHLAILRKILQNTLEARYGKTNHWPPDQKVAWLNLTKTTPRKPKHVKMPPLGISLGIPHNKFSNKELYMGLRYGVIWLLQRLHKFRTLFLEQSVISDDIALKLNCTLKELTSSYHGIDKINLAAPKSQHSATLAQVVTSAWQVIQADPLLTEWQSYAWLLHRQSLNSENYRPTLLMSEPQQKLLLSRFSLNPGSVSGSAKTYGKKDSEWEQLCDLHGSSRTRKITRPCLWGEDWIIHSELENLCMAWLLASERAQKSGIERLAFKDIYITGTSSPTLQISTLKMRRMKNGATPPSIFNVETPIYKQHEPPFQIYSCWLELEARAQRFLKNYNIEQRYINEHTTAADGTIISNSQKSISINKLPLLLIATEGTTWNKIFLREATSNASREAEAFIAIIRNRIDQKKLQPNAKVTLTVSAIGQSLVVEQQLENNTTHLLSAVESSIMGHSETTGRNIYKDGFAALKVEEIIEPVKDFARKVGNEKIEIALEIAKRLRENSRMVTLSELEKICNIDSSYTMQHELLSALDEQDKLTISGEISEDGVTLVVQTDFTAAMMWGYILHLESSLNQIIQSDRFNTTLRYLAQLIHLHHTYKRFDEKLQIDGQALAAELKFPFPPII